MKTVELYARVRHAVLIEGISERAAADRFGALMSQNEIDEVTMTGGGTSSAMPHKANPVNAEILVSLARFNATLLPGLHQSLVHEQERSGAAWTLEWLIFPQMCLAA